MRNLVAGTAGHIDHGKTTLIRALTGIETDRLAEEKRRGITIDLGFAHLQLAPDLTVGFVDVPGHERFVKNMLAGVGGIDLVLFVVAADESVKPQTREHFEICRLLGIRQGIVVLTKADLVDQDLLDLVRLEIDDLTAGSFLEGAPVIAVSARTGEGIPELKNAIAAAASAVPQRSAAGSARLPIDRAFSMRGFGTIVTGTLTEGSIPPEADLQLYPTDRIVRVRGVQVFGKPATRATAGQRTAVNLAGIEPAGITRGMVLSEPHRFSPATLVDCTLELLHSAKPLKHRAPVHFHAGTAELEAEVRLFDGQTTVKPGEQAWVRLVLAKPALLLPGDRFIIRMFSPVATIGGGRIADISGYRYRRPVRAAARLAVLDSGSAAERVALLVTESKFGVSVERLSSALSLPVDAVRAGAPGIQLLLSDDWMVSSAVLTSARVALIEQLRAFHYAHPLLPGISKANLSVPAPLVTELLASTAEVVSGQDIVHLRSHRVVLQEDEAAARQAIESAFETAGLAVPSLADVLARSGIEDKRARSVLQILLRERRLVRISPELIFHVSALSQLHKMLADRSGTRISVGDFKDFTGVSRRYAIPLLEYTDREKWTRREGDSRIVTLNSGSANENRTRI